MAADDEAGRKALSEAMDLMKAGAGDKEGGPTKRTKRKRDDEELDPEKAKKKEDAKRKKEAQKDIAALRTQIVSDLLLIAGSARLPASCLVQPVS